MPIFVTTFTHHGQGWQKIAESPRDRSAPIRASIKELGGRLMGMYYMAGHYDGFIIYEAPNAELVAPVIVAHGLARDIPSLKTSQLYDAAEVRNITDGSETSAGRTPCR